MGPGNFAGRLQLDLRRGVALGSQEMTIPWILAAVLLCVFTITLVLTIRRRTRPGAEPKGSPGPYWPLAIGAMFPAERPSQAEW